MTYVDLSPMEVRSIERTILAFALWLAAAGWGVSTVVGMSSELQTIIGAAVLAVLGAVALTIRRLAKYVVAIIELYLRRRLRNAAEDLGLTRQEIDDIEKNL